MTDINNNENYLRYKLFLKDLQSVIRYCKSKDGTFLGPVQKQEIKDYLELFLFEEYGDENDTTI